MDLEVDSSSEQESFNIDVFNVAIEDFNKEVPSIVTVLNPESESAKRQKADFLAGVIENPVFVYPKIAAMNKEKADAYKIMADHLLAEAANLEEPHRTVYEEFVMTSYQRGELIMAMKAYNEAETPEEKEVAKQEFMRLNIESFGKPDEATYYSLLSDKMAKISKMERSPEAESIFQELCVRLPARAFQSELADMRFQPSDETFNWAYDAFTNLFENLLRHVPDTDEPISIDQLYVIFRNIIEQEFEDSGWKVEQKDVKAISITAKKKVVSVPIDRVPVTATEARGLVGHELGVHVMTAMIGEDTDVAPLQFGLAGYDDTQEGIAMVVQQAIEGKYKEAGSDHYITAGLAYFDDMDFRQAFEIKWRMKLLEDLNPDEVPTQEKIDAIRSRVFDGPQLATTRIFRGTNDLPIFKDLAYYNGSTGVWKYMQQICGDDLLLSLMLSGKRSLSREHQRVVLESGASA